MVGLMALSKAAEPHEMIIAVDGRRTCDVIDFEQSLDKVAAGEVVYLTVVRHERREQIRLALPVRSQNPKELPKRPRKFRDAL